MNKIKKETIQEIYEIAKSSKENKNRTGKNPYFYPITFPESIEIDDKEDWELAEKVYEG